MPIRAKRRRQTGALHNPETLEKAWHRLACRGALSPLPPPDHRPGPTQNRHLQTLSDPDYERREKPRRSWLASHQARSTISRCLSTLRWVARYTGNPGLIQPSNAYYLALSRENGEDPMAKVNTDPNKPMSGNSLRNWLSYVYQGKYPSPLVRDTERPRQPSPHLRPDPPPPRLQPKAPEYPHQARRRRGQKLARERHPAQDDRKPAIHPPLVQ